MARVATDKVFNNMELAIKVGEFPPDEHGRSREHSRHLGDCSCPGCQRLWAELNAPDEEAKLDENQHAIPQHDQPKNSS